MAASAAPAPEFPGSRVAQLPSSRWKSQFQLESESEVPIPSHSIPNPGQLGFVAQINVLKLVNAFISGPLAWSPIGSTSPFVGPKVGVIKNMNCCYIKIHPNGKQQAKIIQRFLRPATSCNSCEILARMSFVSKTWVRANFKES